MHHVLVISFDEVARVESNAYHLMERALQILKQIQPESVVDYYDLLQEEVTSEIAQRFSVADKVIMVFSAKDSTAIPEIYIRALDRLQYYLAGSPLFGEPLLLLIDKNYVFTNSLKDILESVFKRQVKLISEERLLAEEFFPLQEQASSQS